MDEVRPGQIWRSNDPRERGERFVVTRVDNDRVYWRGKKGQTVSAKVEMFGRPSQKGYTREEP